ncbi:response regulator transcription factor [Cohnella thailandensis]|uniref:Response regulator n=1 Tax=Cohnella thailandensis TaxID=557557 RepID=A0A841SY32_9BACL|nr:response regulator [Cohnella thailandensis]MBB6635088.1 response regulator [Cohnella thailandensis]MBP1977903.1 YesN/AraC family two-component response regulator [Cohnella thailandensis]
MRKVLVVDDEKWIRRGLIQLIPWERFGLELAGEAADGQDAYELALEAKPDLMFLDMRMPGLDGKQLLGKLREELPELLTIVVSGYSDFEYTKEAIIHRAFDYLLKPVKKEELASVLEKSLAELERREAQKASVPEAGDREGGWLRAALTSRAGGDSAEGEEAKPPPGWAEGECVVFVAREDAYREDRPDAAKVAEAARARLEQARAFHLGGDWTFALTSGPDGRAELVGAIGSKRPFGGELDRLLTEIRGLLSAAAGATLSLGAGGSASLRPPHLQEACRAAREALGGRKLGEPGTVRLANEGGPASAAAPYPQEAEKAFLLALQMGSGKSAIEQFRRVFEDIATADTTVEGMQRSAAMLVHSIEKQLQLAGCSLESVSGRSPLAYTEMIRQRGDRASVSGLFEREILPAILSSGCQTGGKQGDRLVREVQQLVEAHFDQALSLHQIAETRFVHPDYLSRLFKKTTGRTFVDYLTDYRIHRSIELMKNPAYKNYEIAKKVGYDDYRYFSQIFKKKTGKTIGEFRGTTECASQ